MKSESNLNTPHAIQFIQAHQILIHIFVLYVFYSKSSPLTFCTTFTLINFLHVYQSAEIETRQLENHLNHSIITNVCRFILKVVNDNALTYKCFYLYICCRLSCFPLFSVSKETLKNSASLWFLTTPLQQPVDGSQRRCAARCHFHVLTRFWGSSSWMARCAISVLHISASCTCRCKDCCRCKWKARGKRWAKATITHFKLSLWDREMVLEIFAKWPLEVVLDIYYF